jgi:hypothetical protein
MATRSQPKSIKKQKPKAASPARKPRARTAVRSQAAAAVAAAPRVLPRILATIDDDDKLMAIGAGGGAGFGRCGGRMLGSRLEQVLCDKLSQAGVAHSHAPRHFEVQLGEKQVGAYAPMVVLRGRGREGKSVVIEACEEKEAPIMRKVVAFRAQYGPEFYVIRVAAEEVLDHVPLAAYDESCSTTSVHALVSRLAE